MKLLRSIIPALLALTLALLACARSASNTDSSAGTSTHKITVDNLERTYLLHIPPSYDGTQAMPLVLSLHGGTGNAEHQMTHTNFNPVADKEGFIVAYPNGAGLLGDKILTWNGGTCCGYSVRNNIDDVKFLRAVVTEVESNYKIDPKRIYSTGMSNGAIMSYRLACEASDIFAAIAPVSGTQNISPCTPQQSVSVIHFHGTADQHVPYNGGVGDQSLSQTDFASVKDSIQFWVNEDQCNSTPETKSYDDIQQDTYSGCVNGTTVELYTIINGTHAWPGASGPGWPGGDEPTQSISATQLIWEFFKAHPKL